jgi:hypothetical protein
VETSREAYSPPAPYRALGGRAPAFFEALWGRLARLGTFRPRHPRLWVFGGYTVLALLTIGWYPLSDPTRVCACSYNTDPPTFMWGLGWWPYALVHGLNPLVSHYIWAPVGGNITRSSTVPTAAFVLWPVTALFGPVASYNVLTVASPVLAAFTTYLLCRRLVGRQLPALAAGYLFGFGASEFAQLAAHPNISLVFLIPVMIHVALRRVAGEISARLYVAAIAALLVAQLGLSSEMLATALPIGAVVVVGARFLGPRALRPRVDGLLRETLVGGLVALLLVSPYVYYALFKGGSPNEWPLYDTYGLDLLNPFFPTQVTWLGSSTFHALSQTFNINNIVEADAYLSLPIIIGFCVWVVGARRRLLARLLLLAIATSLLLALGAHLHVAGAQTLELPFNWVKNLPVLRLLTPSRIAVYLTLAVAIGIAAWLAAPASLSLPRRAGRWLVFGLGAVMIFPNVGSGLWNGSPSNPSFFRAGTYRHYLHRGESIVAMPYGWNGDSMLWQAETGFYFRMPEGYLGHIAPPPFEGQQVVGELYSANKPVNPALLASFVKANHVGAFVLDASQVYSMLPFTAELNNLGLRGKRVGGVVLFQVPPSGL